MQDSGRTSPGAKVVGVTVTSPKRLASGQEVCAATIREAAEARAAVTKVLNCMAKMEKLRVFVEAGECGL
jgi:hypothetical protein